jgi:hypothetical protein
VYVLDYTQPMSGEEAPVATLKDISQSKVSSSPSEEWSSMFTNVYKGEGSRCPKEDEAFANKIEF